LIDAETRGGWGKCQCCHPSRCSIF